MSLFDFGREAAAAALRVPVIEAGVAGSAVKSGLKAVGANKQDVIDEVHGLENEAGVLAVVGLVVAGVVAWGAFAWFTGPAKARG